MLEEEYEFGNVSRGIGLDVSEIENAMIQQVPLIVGVESVDKEKCSGLRKGEGHATLIVGLSTNKQIIMLVDPYGCQQPYSVDLVVGENVAYIWAQR
jgi:hypothetical protein